MELTRNLLKPGLSNSIGALSLRIYQTLHSSPNPACGHRAGSSLSGVRRSRIPRGTSLAECRVPSEPAVDSSVWSQEPDTADPIPMRRDHINSLLHNSSGGVGGVSNTQNSSRPDHAGAPHAFMRRRSPQGGKRSRNFARLAAAQTERLWEAVRRGCSALGGEATGAERARSCLTR